MFRKLARAGIALAVAVFLCVGGSPRVFAQGDGPIVPKEREARIAFSEARFEDARKLYSELYGEYLHPVFLLNIGRCYVSLDEPDKAIETFRNYLRHAKGLTPKARAHAQSLIAEMEARKRARAKSQADHETQQATAVATEAAAPEPPKDSPAHPVDKVDNVDRDKDPTSPPSAPAAALEAPLPAEPVPTWRRPLAWSLLGAGAAAAGVGTYFLVKASNEQDRLLLCTQSETPCARLNADDKNRRFHQRLGWSLLGVGVVGVASGLVLILKTPAAAGSSTAAVALDFGSRRANIAVQGTW